MKRYIFLSILIISVSLLSVSCATSTQSRQSSIQKYVFKTGDNLLGEDGSEVPEWILNDASSFDTATVVAYGNSKNKEKAMDAAMKNARDELKKWFNDKMSNISYEYTRRYTDEWGDKNKVFADDFTKNAYVSFLNNFLDNFTVENSWRDADNGQWLLVGVPLPDLRDMLYETAEKTPMDASIVSVKPRISYLCSLIDDQFPPEPFTDGDVIL